MTLPMQIDALRRLLPRVTPGPWSGSDDPEMADYTIDGPYDEDDDTGAEIARGIPRIADAQFIVLARDLLPALVEWIDALADDLRPRA